MRLVAAALCIAATCSPAAIGEPSSLLAQTTYAVVTGQPETRALAPRIAALIDEAVPAIAPIVGTTDLTPVRAVIYTDRREFVRATALPPQSHIVGLATFPAAVIHIDGTGLLAKPERVVPHEVAHVMIARALGPALAVTPVWLSEGIAEYAAGERASQVDPVALRGIGEGTSLRLADLDSAFRAGGDEAGLAYAQAASIVNFLMEERGESVLADLLSSLKETHDLDSALRATTDWRASQLEAAWRRSVSRRWSWALLFESPVLIYGFMVLLFIAGLIRYLRERQRRRQEMDVEDW